MGGSTSSSPGAPPAGSAAPPSPAKKKRDAKKALATAPKDLLRMLSIVPALAIRVASRGARGHSSPPTCARILTPTSLAAGGPSRGLIPGGWKKSWPTAGGAAAAAGAPRRDGAADAFARRWRQQRPRRRDLRRARQPPRALHDETRERRSRHRSAADARTRTIAPARPWWRSCERGIEAARRVAASTCSCTLARGSSTSASTACRRALRRAPAAPLREVMDSAVEEHERHRRRDGAPPVFMQEVDDVDDYVDEGEAGRRRHVRRRLQPPSPRAAGARRRRSSSPRPGAARRACCSPPLPLPPPRAPPTPEAAGAGIGYAVVAAAVAARPRERGRSVMPRRAVDGGAPARVDRRGDRGRQHVVARHDRHREQGQVEVNQFPKTRGRPSSCASSTVRAVATAPEEVRVMLAHRVELAVPRRLRGRARQRAPRRPAPADPPEVRRQAG